jgi:hypothetical protein
MTDSRSTLGEGRGNKVRCEAHCADPVSNKEKEGVEESRCGTNLQKQMLGRGKRVPT